MNAQSRSIAFGIVAAVVALLCLGAVAFASDPWYPVSDNALLELKLGSLPENWPLLGAWSRFGWDHPGPSQFYWLALFYFAAGSASMALVVGTVALHVVSLVGAWWVAWRREALLGWLVLAALLVAIAGRLPGDFLMPWNPYVGIVGYGTFLVLAWDCAERGRVGPVALFALGSFLVQSHLGFLPGVALPMIGAVILALIPRGDTPFPLRWWAVGAALGLIAWIPPLAEQLANTPGNLSLLLSARDGTPPQGLRAALAPFSHYFSLPATWWRPQSYLLPDDWAVPILLTIPLAASVVALVRRSGTQIRLLAVCCLSLLSVVVALSQIRGEPYEYLVSWAPTAALMSTAAGLWVLLDGLPPRVLRIITLVVGTACIVVSGYIAWSVARTEIEPRTPSAAVAAMREAWLAELADGGPVYVDSDVTWDSLSITQGLLVQARHTGTDVGSTEATASLSDPALATGRSGRKVYRVVTLTGPDFSPPRGWTELVVLDPFTVEEWERIADLNRDIAAVPQDASPESKERMQTLTTELRELTDRGAAVALLRKETGG